MILCNWLATSTKTRGGYAELKLKLELIATSIQSLETTQGDYESAKYVCLQFYNSWVYTYLKKICRLPKGDYGIEKRFLAPNLRIMHAIYQDCFHNVHFFL